MEVRISSDALAAIRAHATEDPSVEVCGLLLGEDGSITAAVRTANMAADPRREFEIDPRQLIAAYRAQRSGGPRLLGYYHSHPRGSAEPSNTDYASAAADGRLWLIIAGEEVELWRAEASGFNRCQLVELSPPSSCRT